MAWLRNRVPSATAIGSAHVTGHTLRWHKRSRKDGSGKCDIELTSRNEDLVYGVLYEIDAREKYLLDNAEGLGNGYEEKIVRVAHNCGHVEATTYYATDKNPSLKPYTWYKKLVVAGAREHKLPDDYVAALEAVEAVEDRDLVRSRNAEKCIDAS